MMSYRFSRTKVRSARLLEWCAYLVCKTAGWLGGPGGSAPEPPETVLLVEPFQLGDVASLFVLLDDLLLQWPDCRIMVLTQEKNRALLALEPRIDEVVTVPVPWAGYAGKRGVPRAWWRLWVSMKQVRERRIDIGLDLRGEVRNHILLAMAGCRRRVGYTSYMGSNMKIRGWLLTDNVGPLHAEHRYLLNRRVLAATLPKPLQPIALPCFLPTPTTHKRKSGNRPHVVVHMGGGWEYKRWDVKRWVHVVRTLAEDMNIVLIGAKGEADLLRHVSHALGDTAHETRITSMVELVELLRGADLFLGLDSGPMNVAVALGTPTVALFGPGNSELWYPFGVHDRLLHAVDDLPCHPCFQTVCKFPHHSCMSRISAHEVVEAVRSVLAAEQPAS